MEGEAGSFHEARVPRRPQARPLTQLSSFADGESERSGDIADARQAGGAVGGMAAGRPLQRMRRMCLAGSGTEELLGARLRFAPPETASW